MKQIYFTLPLIFWDYIPSTVRDKSDWHLCSPMGKGAVRNIQALRNAARVYKYSLSWFSWLQMENSVFAHVGDINQCFPGYEIPLWASVEMTSGAVTLSIIPTDFLYPDSKRNIIQRHWIQNMLGLGDKTITICIAIDTWAISIKNVFDKTFDIFYSSSEENSGCEASLVALTKALALW